MSLFQHSVSDALSTFESLRALEPSVLQAAEWVRQCLISGSKLLVAGNGGSAADGADFATEYTCRFIQDRKPFPAINLTACGSLLSAIGNDYGYEWSFARQVEAFGRPGDLLVVLSTSGNSVNIMRAIETAKAIGIQSIALLGRDGGRCRGKADLELLVAARVTARIQEAHKFLLHSICENAEEALQKASLSGLEG
jgi:D-sedoheptulose 7-phosphate isomerase